MSQNTVHLSQLIRKKNFAESEKIIISFIIDIVNKGGIKVSAPKPVNPFEPPKITQEETLYSFVNQF